MENKLFTPETISELKENEIFVFGSNKLGRHTSGAARTAVEKFGAVMGQAEGLQGQSYAIPTLDENMRKVSKDKIRDAVLRLYEEANDSLELTFYVTKIGCGIAGFTTEEMKDLFSTILPPENVILPREFCVTEGYKAFNPNMTCRGLLYNEGKVYEIEDEPELFGNGYHFCESPFETLTHYQLVDTDCLLVPRAPVTALGRVYGDEKEFKTTRESIYVTEKIKIGFKLDLPGFIAAGIKYLREKISDCANDRYRANIRSSYDFARIGSSSDSTLIASTGYGAQIVASGEAPKIHAAGERPVIAASGDAPRILSSGIGAHIVASGDYAQIASLENDARIAASGKHTQINSSGYAPQIAASGEVPRIAASGDSARIVSSGTAGKIASSGDHTKINCTGRNSVIAAIGKNNKAKAGLGSWIVLAEYDAETPVAVVSKRVDDVTIKADTWYKLVGGEFVEVGDQI